MGSESKIIVLTGHGYWDHKTNQNAFSKLPGKCSFHFYTDNSILMTASFGNELEKGKLNSRSPAQKMGPYQMVQNMTLTWPRGLTVMPPPMNWEHVSWEIGASGKKLLELKGKLTKGNNILFQIKKPDTPESGLQILKDPFGHLFLEEIFDILQPAIQPAKKVLIVWSACRESALKTTPFKTKRAIKREYIDDFVKEMKEEGFPLSKEQIMPMWNWVGRLMTQDEVEDSIELTELVKSHPKPKDFWAAWKECLPTLLCNRATNPLKNEVDNILQRDRRRDENFVPAGFKKGSVAPPVPTRKGRPPLPGKKS